MDPDDHRHCKECGKVCEVGSEVCSSACRSARESRLDSRRNNVRFMYVLIAVAALLFVLSLVRL